MRLTDSMREETEERNRLLDERALTNVADPKERYVPPDREAPVPYLNFAPLQNALVRLQEAARRYDRAAERALSGGRTLSREQRAALDRLLTETERAMTRDEGLPRRPWFKHQIYAPGFYTGYGVKTLPGVREAIEQRNWDEATREIEVVAQTLRAVADKIEQAAKMLEEAS
jgi:N-acetylated-alpha-linked acidic dipeptidase